ncbi:immunity 70 family protein [Enterococcus sp. AZ007]|uniref:immunity 70 family protein n=1 Tax=Enterococcus sp. AZ007 TaxID=2774839 RepID=UPI003F25820A
MTIGLKVDYLWFSIGTGDFLFSFFSNVCAHLEKMKWGDQYPIVMNELYEGILPKEHLELAQKELAEIQMKFAEVPPEKIIWDIEDLDRRPPWGNEISNEITNLSEYFVTDDGKNLFEVLEVAINEERNKGTDVVIE